MDGKHAETDLAGTLVCEKCEMDCYPESPCECCVLEMGRMNYEWFLAISGAVAGLEAAIQHFDNNVPGLGVIMVRENLAKLTETRDKKW